MTKPAQTTDLSLLASAIQQAERRYQRTPTWILAVAFAAALAALAVFAYHQQVALDEYQNCVEAHGFDGSACRN
jgi:type VI protein secretion system component VasF